MNNYKFIFKIMALFPHDCLRIYQIKTTFRNIGILRTCLEEFMQPHWQDTFAIWCDHIPTP